MMIEMNEQTLRSTDISGGRRHCLGSGTVIPGIMHVGRKLNLLTPEQRFRLIR